MIRANTKKSMQVWLILLLAAELALVYPVHIIVDHSGLFHSHDHHKLESHHPFDDFQDEDHCIFCVNLSSMKDSSFESFIPVFRKDAVENAENAIHETEPAHKKSARGPPYIFLI